MTRNRTLYAALVAAAAATIALPAAAGDGERPYRDPAKAAAIAPAGTAVATSMAKDGFEFVGGESGWKLAQHKYVWVGGRFQHSDECDHEIRQVKALTPVELKSARDFSPGG